MFRKGTRKIITLSALILSGNTVLAQITPEWSKTYGGNGADRGHCIQQTSDGGFIISGYTDTNNNGDVSGYHGGGDVWVVKLDVSGDLEWQKTYGGTGSEPFTEAFTNIIQTSDGGYLITAESNSSDGDLTLNHGNLDLWVFKINASGDIEWQKSLGGGVHEGAHAILQEPDGGFLLAGYTSSADGDVVGNQGMSDGWLVKLGATGDLEWQKTMGGTWTDAFTAIRHTADGGYILAGYTLSDDGDLTGLNPDGFAGYADYWIVKLNSSAVIEWQTVVGGSGKDEAKGIIQTPDGNYIVAGETVSTDGDISTSFGERDWWVVKLNATGVLQWEKSLGGSARDEVSGIEANAGGSTFFVVGTTQSTDGNVTDNHGNKDVWLVKLDDSGNTLANQCFGGTENEIGFFAVECTDGGIIITGRTNSDSNGDILNDTQGEDLWAFKLGGNAAGIADNSTLSMLSAYPNPVVDVLHFSEPLKNIRVYAVNGQLLTEASDSAEVDFTDLSPGTYLVKAVNEGGETTVRKIIKK